MAYQKSKISVENESYEIAQAHDAQFKATSDDKDTSNSDTWADIEPLENDEINSNIFNKMSKMFSNVRYLYNELGGSGGVGTTIIKELDTVTKNKAPLKHRHSVVDKVDNIRVIPTNDVKSNSNDTLPTCALLSELDKYTKDTKGDGSSIIYNKLVEVETLYDTYTKTVPNNRYEDKTIATFSSTDDINNFLNTYNSSNNYFGLSLGNTIKINDGVYNIEWVIAGFDTEENDGSNNGKGICLIPKTPILPSIGRFQTGSIHGNYYYGARGNIRYGYFVAQAYFQTPLFFFLNGSSSDPLNSDGRTFNNVSPRYSTTFIDTMLSLFGSHLVARNAKIPSCNLMYYTITSDKIGTYTTTPNYMTPLTITEVYGSPSQIAWDKSNGIFSHSGSLPNEIVSTCIRQQGFSSSKLPLFDHISPHKYSNNPFYLIEVATVATNGTDTYIISRPSDSSAYAAYGGYLDCNNARTNLDTVGLRPKIYIR